MQINGSLARAAIKDLSDQGVIRVVSKSGASCPRHLRSCFIVAGSGANDLPSTVWLHVFIDAL